MDDLEVTYLIAHTKGKKKTTLCKVWDMLKTPKFSFELPLQFFNTQFIVAKLAGLPIQRTHISGRTHTRTGGMTIYYKLSQRQQAYEKLQKYIDFSSRPRLKQSFGRAVLDGQYVTKLHSKGKRHHVRGRFV